MFAVGTVSAANVHMMGVIDTGLTYTHADAGIGESTSSLSMQGAGRKNNRVILVGSEDISRDLKAGFWLEAGYNSDTGSAEDSLLFQRGAWVYLEHTDLGQLSAGRIGMMRSGATPLTSTILGDRIHPLGSDWPSTNWPLYAMPFYGYSTSNVLHWASPKMGGAQVIVQHAMGGDDGGTEGKSDTARYTAAAVTFEAGRFQGAVMADWLNEASKAGEPDNKDAFSLTVGGNYDFESFRAFGFVQYFRDVDGSTFIPLPGMSGYDLFGNCDRIRGYVASAGVTVPVMSGKAHFAGTYMHAESKDAVSVIPNEDKLGRLGLYAAYEYPLSKRTTVYTIANYWKDSMQDQNPSAQQFKDPSAFLFSVGICHEF